MFWFLFGVVTVSFTIGALIGYKFHAWKEYKDYTADWDRN